MSRQADREPRVVFGFHAVLARLRADPSSVLEIYLDETRNDARARDLAALAERTKVHLMRVPTRRLDGFYGGGRHQGVVARIEIKKTSDSLDEILEGVERPLLLVLDGVTDPHNLGAIARSAAAFGADGLVVPERRSVGVTASAWKASAGTLARLPVAKAGNLVRTLTSYAEAGLMIAGLDGRGEIDLDGLELATGPLVLVVGAEGRGLSRLVGERCDLTVRIPLAGSVESLNASVAAGVALAEIARRRRNS